MRHIAGPAILLAGKALKCKARLCARVDHERDGNGTAGSCLTGRLILHQHLRNTTKHASFRNEGTAGMMVVKPRYASGIAFLVDLKSVTVKEW